MTSPHFSSDIDLIAFETIPRLDEAQAILDALELVVSEAPTATMPPAYLSFVFEASGKLPGGRDGGEEILALLARHQGRWPVVGMGVNCTKMPILEKVVRDLAGDKGLHLFVSHRNPHPPFQSSLTHARSSTPTAASHGTALLENGGAPPLQTAGLSRWRSWQRRQSRNGRESGLVGAVRWGLRRFESLESWCRTAAGQSNRWRR